MKVSFDFDDTLAETIIHIDEEILIPKNKIVSLLKDHHSKGDICVILTARNNTIKDKSDIEIFLYYNDLTHMISDIIFTSHTYKGKFTLEHNIDFHYDDDDEHLESIREVGVGCINSLHIQPKSA